MSIVTVAALGLPAVATADPVIPAPANGSATKFARVEPSRPGDRRPPARAMGPNGPTLAAATTVDTTAPTAPGVPAASARSLIGISASWSGAQDAESGIDAYAFAIGTNPTGDATALAGTRWWQIANGTTASVSIALDPTTTYYVSVYAINGAGIAGPTATSAPIRPTWRELGASTNTVTVAFGATGYNSAGAPTAGWSAAQVATMSAFTARMLPIITARYGPPAEAYTVTVVRDLRYARSNVFIPSTDEIRMDDTFSPQLLTHELLHAYRSDFLLSSDALWAYEWQYHRLNGATGAGTVTDGAGATVWTGPLQISPTTNPADGYMAFGSATKGLTTATSLSPWPGGSTADYVMGLTALSLYRFDSSFTDPATGTVTSNRIHRVLGSAVAGGFGGVYGGVIGHPTGTITIDHDAFPAEPPIAVTNGAFAATRAWTGIPNARTGGRDSVPGGVTITFTDATTGAIYRVRRNIDIGGSTGSQMFMLDLGPDDLLDRTAPTIGITSPASSAVVSGTTTIAATAQDDIGVTRVEFAIDGARIATDTTAPFTAAWDTRPSALGYHTVHATAFDAAGRSTTSLAVVTIADLTAPTVVLAGPVANSTVGGLVNVTADATDDRAVSRVEFSIDAKLVATDTAAPFTYTWNADAVALGAHRITARAVDPAGRATSTSIALTVADLAPPSVTLTAPGPNAFLTVASKVTIGATAADNRKIARVEFWIDGVLKLKDTTAPFAYVWTVPTPKGVKHTLLARAVDTANRTADASVTVTAN